MLSFTGAFIRWSRKSFTNFHVLFHPLSLLSPLSLVKNHRSEGKSCCKNEKSINKTLINYTINHEAKANCNSLSFCRQKEAKASWFDFQTHCYSNLFCSTKKRSEYEIAHGYYYYCSESLVYVYFSFSLSSLPPSSTIMTRLKFIKIDSTSGMELCKYSTLFHSHTHIRFYFIFCPSFICMLLSFGEGDFYWYLQLTWKRISHKSSLSECFKSNWHALSVHNECVLVAKEALNRVTLMNDDSESLACVRFRIS